MGYLGLCVSHAHLQYLVAISSISIDAHAKKRHDAGISSQPWNLEDIPGYTEALATRIDEFKWDEREESKQMDRFLLHLENHFNVPDVVAVDLTGSRQFLTNHVVGLKGTTDIGFFYAPSGAVNLEDIHIREQLLWTLELKKRIDPGAQRQAEAQVFTSIGAHGWGGGVFDGSRGHLYRLVYENEKIVEYHTGALCASAFYHFLRHFITTMAQQCADAKAPPCLYFKVPAPAHLDSWGPPEEQLEGLDEEDRADLVRHHLITKFFRDHSYVDGVSAPPPLTQAALNMYG